VKVFIISLLLGIMVMFSGCAAKTGNSKLAEATNESVSQTIVKGTSTKADLRRSFGEPQKVDFTESGLEKWEYQFIRKSHKAINFVPIAGAFVGGTNDTTKTLLVVFKGDVVENYALSTAQGETKAGLFQ